MIQVCIWFLLGLLQAPKVQSLTSGVQRFVDDDCVTDLQDVAIGPKSSWISTRPFSETWGVMGAYHRGMLKANWASIPNLLDSLGGSSSKAHQPIPDELPVTIHSQQSNTSMLTMSFKTVAGLLKSPIDLILRARNRCNIPFNALVGSLIMAFSPTFYSPSCGPNQQ
ncbi:hypothetical protein L210DRAFT_3525726 [Boletus edulis BED1]|uniref:Uncharacterized protein n=1 Tax=Boletus edulis BED1 TaxID=1328754 RepID=A0AAD4GK29_BOLED|nr:hypothetical protein L210DRAFT_3525726 [Boletus edulis BED1]